MQALWERRQIANYRPMHKNPRCVPLVNRLSVKPASRPLQRLGSLSLCGAIIALSSSCGRYSAERTAPADAAVTSAPSDVDHDHPQGMMGGVICSIGGDRYHAEAVIEEGGALAIYTLAHDPTEVQEVQQQALTAYAKREHSGTSTVILLEPDPTPGDRDGMTSRFSGQLPEQLLRDSLYLTVPQLRIEGERFVLRFKISSPSHGDMPAGVGGREAAELYLTPGGRYTEADIEANGRATAMEKYAGFRAAHDFSPLPGELVCPISRTKANPQCRWIIGGETYFFCCPPCIDEFLVLAKSQPDALLPPQEYVQQQE